jgi:dienelactone hydrolase
MSMRTLSIAATCFSFVVGRGDAQVARGPDTVVVHSRTLALRAIVWQPAGHGPFPAILFNHGSGHASGRSTSGPDQRHPELLGPVFARHGYVFLYLYRRGDGLSRGQGVPAGDRMDSAFATRGQQARNDIQLSALDDETDDALAGLAYLRALPDVDPNRLAVVGHSFGGAITVLVAQRDTGVKAIVAFSAAGGGGYSWDRSPELRARLITAVDRMRSAAFYIHAENDYSTGAGKALGAEMERIGKPHRVKIYPPVGHSMDDGHNFVHLAIPVWEPDVFPFLDQHVKAHPR